MNKLEKQFIEEILPLTPVQEGILLLYLKETGEKKKVLQALRRPLKTLRF